VSNSPSAPLQPGERPLLFVVVGPTAIGKTSLAIGLAKWLGCEILNADSRQVYRDMRIGTAQPTEAERAEVPHHFVDFLDVETLYSAGQFEKDALAWLDHWFSSHRTAVMVGGSGLYIKAVLDGLDDIPASVEIRTMLQQQLEESGIDPLLAQLEELDPLQHAKIDHANTQRVIRALEVCLASGKAFSSFHSNRAVERPFDVRIIGMEMNREWLIERIDARVDVMIEEGFEAEARSFHDRAHLNALQTVGYREWFDCFDGKRSKEEAIRAIQVHTRQFAKRQMTWFKRMDGVNWFDAADRMAAFNWAMACCAERGWSPTPIEGEELL
jgi:tRNA dimethylallyltransferase